MLTIKSVYVNADTFNFFCSLEVASIGEYLVSFQYDVASDSPFKLGETSKKETFGCLTAALDYFDEVVYFAESNKFSANNAYRTWLNNKDSEELNAFRDSLEDEWIKSSLLLVSEEADDENEVYVSNYSYNGLTVTQTYVGLDVEMKVSVDGFTLADDLYSFEGGHWPTPQEYIIALLY